MITVEITPGRQVCAYAETVLHHDYGDVAEAMRDVLTFATHDVFHRQIVARDPGAEGQPKVRGRLWIEHAFMGFTVVRQGSLLWRKEGRGFGFSDLSRKDPRRGFPHACHYLLHEREDGGCALQLRVNGRWTARLIPRFIVGAYLRLVMWASVKSARRAMARKLTTMKPERTPQINPENTTRQISLTQECTI